MVHLFNFNMFCTAIGVFSFELHCLNEVNVDYSFKMPHLNIKNQHFNHNDQKQFFNGSSIDSLNQILWHYYESEQDGNLRRKYIVYSQLT